MTEAGDLAAAQAAIGHSFADAGLLKLALTHPSARQTGPAGADYQRLEFLGDRVLALVVADMLYTRFPKEEEGALARRHVSLVRREALCEVARGLDLGRFIQTAEGPGQDAVRESPAVLADVCEALIAAVYMDAGLAAAAAFIEAHWTALLEADAKPPRDAKTALQEWAQGRALPLPCYRQVARSGPDHDPVFEVEVAVEGRSPQVGRGRAKRAAEQAAAAALLADLEADLKGRP